MFNLAVLLRESAGSFPDKVVARFPGGALTYADLDRRSDSLAAGLARRGIEPGDAVGLHLPNVPEFLVAYFGILKAGAVVVPMNPLLKSAEVAHQLGDSGARAVITWATFAEEAAAAAAAVDVDQVFVAGGEPGGPGIPFQDLYAGPDGARPFAARGLEDTAVIIYTSGTTGVPKGAELTHGQLYLNCDIPGRLFGISPDDVMLAVLPLFHVFALSSVLNLVVRAGASLSLVPRFEPGVVLDTIGRDRVSIVAGVPTMFVALLGQLDQGAYDVSSLRVAISGGAAIPAEVMDAFESRFGVTVLEGYGLTETAATTTFNRSATERRAYSVGKPIWGTELEIWDETGSALPRGREHVGEIVTRGFHVMKGYHRQPEATAEAFQGGWFHTGDLGYVDDDGFVFVVDRKKELVIRGGYNVYPREVEEALYGHPAVAEAAVVGVPHERLGEEVKAYVALKPGHAVTPDELVGYCRDRLAAYKYPRSVEVLDELPKNATGKISKRELPR